MTIDLDWIARVSGAAAAARGERIQSLWSGYGEVLRVRLRGGDAPSVVVKWVRPPAQRPREQRPREPEAQRSHARKLRSYEVELAFYRGPAARCDDASRVARLLGAVSHGAERVLVLEDLDASGFDGRRRFAGGDELGACLEWLAAFHATHLGAEPRGLWPRGTYWHLATRPDELAIVADAALREAAPILDARLRAATHRTLVHGDAKLANFCFGRDAVAAVDFQYVGGGCGMEDVAYLIGDAPEATEARLLDRYFRALRERLPAGAPGDAIEREWRALYPLAWADFQRFLAGWSPAHAASDARSRARLRAIVAAL